MAFSLGDALIAALLTTWLIFLVGRKMIEEIAGRSPHHQIRGRIVLGATMLGFFGPAMTCIIGSWLAGEQNCRFMPLAVLSLVFGPVFGNVIGAIAVPPEPEEPEPMPRQIEPEPADAKKGGKPGEGTAEG